MVNYSKSNSNDFGLGSMKLSSFLNGNDDKKM